MGTMLLIENEMQMQNCLLYLALSQKLSFKPGKYQTLSTSDQQPATSNQQLNHPNPPPSPLKYFSAFQYAVRKVCAYTICSEMPVQG